MKTSILIGFGLVATAVAQNITYNVVTLLPSRNRMCVSVNDNVFPLAQSSVSELLFTGEAPVGATYRYCILNAQNHVLELEHFTRQLATNGSTINEIYNRTQTVFSVPELPMLWEYSYTSKLSDELHPEGHIATLHFKANSKHIETLHANITEDVKVQGSLTYISHSQVKSIKQAQIKLSGRSSRLWSKQSYNIKIDDDENLYGLQKFKLRAEPNDPTYMREKLYYDILRKSAGVPSRGASWVRVIFNDKPIGLFLIVDQLDKTWLSAAFNGNDDSLSTGVLYMGNMVLQNATETTIYKSDLTYLGDDQAQYGVMNAYLLKAKSSDKEDKDFSKLADFTKQISDSKNYDANQWNSILDVDVFLKNMAIEFLQGHMDGYLSNQNNYYIYNHQGKWTWLSNDVDYVMGNFVGNQSSLWTGDYMKFGDKSRPLMQAILNVPEFSTAYEGYIKKLVQELYNLQALSPRIDALKTMLVEDVNWDQSLSRMTGQPNSPVVDGLEKVQEYVSKLARGGHAADVHDYYQRITSQRLTFDMAVDGQTGYSTLYGLKEWIENKAANVRMALHMS